MEGGLDSGDDHMSLYEYQTSSEIVAEYDTFFAILMAAMRQADTENAMALRSAFPETWAELQARYEARGGLLEGEVSRDGRYRMVAGELVDVEPC